MEQSNDGVGLVEGCLWCPEGEHDLLKERAVLACHEYKPRRLDSTSEPKSSGCNFILHYTMPKNESMDSLHGNSKNPSCKGNIYPLVPFRGTRGSP